MPLSRKTDRRRRLLVDASTPLGDAPAAPDTPLAPSQPKGGLAEARPYSIAAQRRHQRKTTDLIPKRRLAYSGAIIILLLALVGINLLAIYSPGWEVAIGQEGVSALAIWGPGTLSSWFATVCWMVAAATCLQIFVLRRHRNDDYEGTYRVWGWLTLACGLASLMCMVHLPAIVSNLMAFLTSMSFADPAWLPIAIIGVLSSVFAARVLFEVRSSYGTVAWVVLAWLVFNLGMLAPGVESSSADASFGWVSNWGIQGSVVAALIGGNAMLVVASSSLMANVTYARFVFLRANGLVKLPLVNGLLSEDVELETDSNGSQDALNDSSKKKTATAGTRKTKRKATKPAASERKSRKKAVVSGTSAAGKVSKPTASQTSSAGDSLAEVAAETESQSRPATVKYPVSNSTSNETERETVAPAASTSGDASERLRQMAAASRAKQAAAAQSESGSRGSESAEASTSAASKKATARQSKAERRKARKQQRQAKRAA